MKTAPNLKNDGSVELLLTEKQKLLNIPCCESKDGFVKKLRQLVRLEQRLSRKKIN